jgi:hypothetical protein
LKPATVQELRDTPQMRDFLGRQGGHRIDQFRVRGIMGHEVEPEQRRLLFADRVIGEKFRQAFGGELGPTGSRGREKRQLIDGFEKTATRPFATTARLRHRALPA